MKAYYARNRDKINSYQRDWRKNNPDRVNDTQLRKKYGITVKQRDALLSEQGGVCAICTTDAPGNTGWYVDHCHNSGAVRGVLCHHCNSLLGYARDNPQTLSKAIQYLS
jgi:hypothetical protein